MFENDVLSNMYGGKIQLKQTLVVVVVLIDANRSGFGCYPLTNIDNGGVEPTMVSVIWLLSVHSAFHMSTSLRKH
jgi:hypothetical protein